MPVRLCRPHDRRVELPGVVGGEGEAVALRRHRVVVLDRVREPPGRSHHRDGAVPQGDQLGQTTGLVARRHPQHVRAGVDALRERRVEPDRRRDLPGPLGRIAPEHVLVTAVAGADDHHLHAKLQQRRHRLLDEVQALDVVQARNHRTQGPVGLLQPELAAQLRAVQRLGFGCGGRVVVRDIRIALRIEDLVVDAVDDSVQLVPVRADELVKPFTQLGRLDFGRVAFADGVDDIREVDSATEHVDDVVETGNADPDQAPPIEAGQRERTESEDPLGREVVDGESRGDLGDRTVGVDTVDEVGHESGIPIVDLDHVW